MFVPVLPTTPLLLLATFLFAKSSPRCHAWICSTRVYKTYVEAFKQAGGIPAATKARILAVSFALLGASAYFVQKPAVWAVLGCVAVFLLYLMIVRIPPYRPNPAPHARPSRRNKASKEAAAEGMLPPQAHCRPESAPRFLRSILGATIGREAGVRPLSRPKAAVSGGSGSGPLRVPYALM